jgi:hypothetical protein
LTAHNMNSQTQSLVLIAFGIAAAILVLTLVGSALGKVIGRRKTMRLLQERQPSIWSQVLASPDSATPFGRAQTSASRFLRLLKGADPQSLNDPELLEVARSLFDAQALPF